MNIDLIHSGTMISVLGRDSVTGALGIALASTAIAVGSRCPHVEIGRAAVASQGFTNLKVGPLALDLVRCGLTAQEVLEALRQHDRWLDYRQIGIITADGQIEAHTGSMNTGWAGHLIGEDVLCLGNGLKSQGEALFAARSQFLESQGLPLADRLLIALQKGCCSSACAFPVMSSSLLVRQPGSESQVDLRIDFPKTSSDDQDDALADLHTLYQEYRPLIDVYAARSVAPRSF